MSDVNQAFLRAYIKNRTASPEQVTSTSDAPSVTKTSNIRVDPAHKPLAQTAPEMVPAAIQSPKHNEYSYNQPGPANERIARQGVWSPIGAERGLKATMQSMSMPAVVRNGVPSITNEVNQIRYDSAHAKPSEQATLQPNMTAQVQAHASNKTATSIPSNQNAKPQRPVADVASFAYDTTYIPTHDTAFPELTRQSRLSEQTAAPVQRPLSSPSDDRSRTSGTSNDPSSRRIDSAHAHVLHGPHSRSSTTIQNKRGNTFSTSQPPLTEQPSFVSSESELKPIQREANIAPAVAPLPLPVAFAPSWEVDQFSWPEVVLKLQESNLEAFKQIGKHLSLANRDGLRVMAITSGERGVGRTTVAMHMARAAAAAGLKVAVVDADPYSPSIVDQLRLELEHGWQDCLFENVPLQEAAVHSIADRITIFPLTSAISANQVQANLHRMTKMVKRISTAFDLVLLDANRLNLEQRDLMGVSQETVVDAAIVVVDTELSIKEKVDSAVSILQSMGLASIGLVENFQS